MPKLKVDLRSVSSSRHCAKCGAGGNLARHHTGCERMWLRHFEAQEKTQVYKRFKAKYEAFRPEDTVPLCNGCHMKIHDIYYIIICIDIQRSGKIPFEWTWKQADRLMNKLRQACDIWLKAKSLAESSPNYPE